MSANVKKAWDTLWDVFKVIPRPANRVVKVIVQHEKPDFGTSGGHLELLAAIVDDVAGEPK
jgi:hypothetical protein